MICTRYKLLQVMQRLVQNKKNTNQTMYFCLNMDNCLKQYPEVKLQVDVRGFLHIICPVKHEPEDIIPRIVETLGRDNKDLTFSPEVNMRTSSEIWDAEISLDLRIEYFVKDSSESIPVNGKVSRIFATLHFPGTIQTIQNIHQIFKVNSAEEAHKMALGHQQCYGYDLSTREDSIVDCETITGEPDTIKRVVFGKVLTIEDVRNMKDFIAEPICLAMKVFHKDKIVKTRCGNFVAWEKGVEYSE